MSRVVSSDAGRVIAKAPSRIEGWLVVNARPNREQTAVVNLARQGYEPYCPQIAKLIRHARTSVVKPRPLFPGYVFVRHHPEQTLWRPILSTIGVRSLVRFGDQLGRLDDAFVAALRQCERDGVVVAPAAVYEIGQNVEVLLPAFAGVIGKIMAIDDMSRITVLIEMMQRSVKLKVTADKLASIKGARNLPQV